MITVEAKSLIDKLAERQRALMSGDPRYDRALVRIGTVTQAGIVERIMHWKLRGHLWKYGALVNSIQYAVKGKTVHVFSAGTRYAHVHEFGTVGKGGQLPDIVPRRRKFLTIPLEKQYERVKPRSLDLEFVEDTKGRFWLWDDRRRRLAYRLVKKVSIPARPYFFPGVKMTQARRMEIVRSLVKLEVQP
jgi:hypothetical protein